MSFKVGDRVIKIDGRFTGEIGTVASVYEDGEYMVELDNGEDWSCVEEFLRLVNVGDVVCSKVDIENASVTYTTVQPSPSCHCQNLLAGHDERCSYHKQDYEDPRTRTDLWGILRQEAKTRAEINVEHKSLADSHGEHLRVHNDYLQHLAFPKGRFK